jgi:hypothetical protein
MKNEKGDKPKKDKIPKPTDLSKAFEKMFKRIKSNHNRASSKPEK